MKKKLLKKMDKILTPTQKAINTPQGPIILFGYINEPPGGGGGGESTSDGTGGTLPNGNLSSNYQEQVSDAFWPPITSFVRFTFLSSGAFSPNVIVQTRSLGSYKTKNAVASTFVWRTLDVETAKKQFKRINKKMAI